MAGGHLDLLGVRVQARAPADDAIVSRVDRDEADVGREGRLEVGHELLAASAITARDLDQSRHAERAEQADGVDLRAHERMDGERVEVRAAERDDPRDQLGPAHGEHAGEVAAAALPDDRHGRAVSLGHLLQALRQPLDGGGRAVDVRADPRPLRPVAVAAQPCGHQPQRVVAGEKARDQQHRPPAAGLQIAPAPRARAQQRGGLECDATLVPEPRARSQGSHFCSFRYVLGGAQADAPLPNQRTATPRARATRDAR